MVTNWTQPGALSILHNLRAYLLVNTGNVLAISKPVWHYSTRQLRTSRFEKLIGVDENG